MKKFLYAISGVAVVLAARGLSRLRALQEEIGERWEEVDTKQLSKQFSRLSRRAGRAEPSAFKGQLKAMAAAAETLRDRRLKKQVKGLQKTIDRLDAKALKKQAKARTSAVRSAKLGRQPRRFPVIPVAIALGAIGLGVLASRRRDQIASQLGGLQDGAGRKLPGVIDNLKSRAPGQAKPDEQELRAGVESAIHTAAPAIAPDLKVEVEGRTVYLRGATTDRELLESAVKRAQEVTGVAAVINLVSMTPPATNGASQKTGATTGQG